MSKEFALVDKNDAVCYYYHVGSINLVYYAGAFCGFLSRFEFATIISGTKDLKLKKVSLAVIEKTQSCNHVVGMVVEYRVRSVDSGSWLRSKDRPPFSHDYYTTVVTTLHYTTLNYFVQEREKEERRQVNQQRETHSIGLQALPKCPLSQWYGSLFTGAFR